MVADRSGRGVGRRRGRRGRVAAGVVIVVATAGREREAEMGRPDLWAAIFPVGDDASGSRRRTRALLQELATAG